MSRRLSAALPELRERLDRVSHLLLGLDFDGTLSPIIDRPERVALPDDTRRVIESLAGRPDCTVAILSGRKLRDLEERMRMPGLIYAGNHGLEIEGPGISFVEPTARACRPTLAKVAAELTEDLKSVHGARLEDKELSLSVHIRQVPAHAVDEVRRRVEAAVADASAQLRITEGNKVFEIRPGAPWNKGSALRWIEQRLSKPDPCTIYAGDDTTDEDVFVELPDAITIRVGPDAPTAAHCSVENPTEVRRFLVWLDNVGRMAHPSCT